MLLMLYVLGGVLALLLVIVGYLRLREWACGKLPVRAPRENLRAAKVKALAVACVVIIAVMGLFFLA
jgi:hypothetical protein